MRLIDADNFMKDLLKLWDYSTVDGITATKVLKQVISDLNNAPTVSPFKPMCMAKDEAICEEMTTDGHCNYSKPCLNKGEDRPQGEWIDYDNTFYKCPDCGYLLEKCCPQCQNKVILPKGGAE